MHVTDGTAGPGAGAWWFLWWMVLGCGKVRRAKTGEGVGGAGENLIRARSGEPRVTQRRQRKRGERGAGCCAVDEDQPEKQERRQARTVEPGGRNFLRGLGRAKGCAGADSAGQTGQGAARSSGCGDFRWPGAGAFPRLYFGAAFLRLKRRRPRPASSQRAARAAVRWA